MTNISTFTAGIDVSKAKLDLAIFGLLSTLMVTNDEGGWAKAAAWLRQNLVTRVGLEATGGYERGVRRYLEAQEFIVDILQPLQVKAFARAGLRRAKSDRLDAVLIAHCTHVMARQSRLAPDARFDALADHLTYIDQIQEDKIRAQTRLEHITAPRLRREMTRDILKLTKRHAQEIKRLRAEIAEHADLSERFALLLSIPAIGEATALCLLVRMPELGHVSREEVASMVGLAPFVHQSGAHQGQSRIGGGRAKVRKSLYMAALPGASFHHPLLKDFNKRLVKNGKSGKCALVACARKLLVYANTVVARGTPWEASRPAKA